MRGRILIVEDDVSLCEMMESDLARRGFEVTWTISAHEALGKCLVEKLDVVLTDWRMPELSGEDLCERVVANRPDVPVVVMTAFGSLDSAVEAIRAGAYDFVTKPVEMDVLALTLDRAVKYRRLKGEVRLLSDPERLECSFGELAGDSSAMRMLYDQLDRLAGSEMSVLITGESGTGKEIVARALHDQSPRSAGPFVATNCSALPESLMENEIFGHVEGAYTGARGASSGLFVQADGGTLLLDEIGEMPIALQPKLLRALEERVVRPIGGETEVPFDTRILAASNRDLETAVSRGLFREDLFYRLNVIRITLPPLRSRGADVLILASHFIERFASQTEKDIVGLADPAAVKLLSYEWPGNVRELRNAMERAVALTRHERILVEDLPEAIRDYRSSRVFVPGSDSEELVTLEEVERRYILHVLKAVGGNKTRASRILGLDRKTIYRKLARSGQGPLVEGPG